MKERGRLAVSTVLLLSVWQAAAFGADARHGEAIAERWCSGCHIVSKGQSQGGTEAPPFSEIAERPGFDPGHVALFLLAPHPPMQGLGLSREDARDLAAYVGSQRSR
jgi:mono/diheme cytochrome c family protein